MLPERDAILGALENVIDPELHKPVTELDMVRDVVVRDGGHVEVTSRSPSPAAPCAPRSRTRCSGSSAPSRA